MDKEKSITAVPIAVNAGLPITKDKGPLLAASGPLSANLMRPLR
jgi:hypothetical protein